VAQRRPLILLVIVFAIVAAGAGLTEGLFRQADQRPAVRVQSPGPPGSIAPARTVLPELSASVSDTPARRDVTRLNSEGMALYEIGRFGDALKKFAQAAAKDATDRAVQRNLALTKARLAWVRLERGEPDEAVRAFEEANRLRPDEGAVLLGLGAAHLYRGDEPEAEVFLQRAVEADPTQILALKLLGEIAYRRDDLPAARPRFEAALRLDPSDAAVRDRLDLILAEVGAQKKLRRLESRHFTVRFEREQGEAPARAVLARLESARREISVRLGVYPERKIPVVLSAGGAFHEHVQAPDWVQGLFDGKIRLPAEGAMGDGAALDRVLRHEYTHALVHDRTGGRAPTWLSEGLAITCEGRTTDRERQIVQSSDHLIPIRELHGSFLTLPRTEVPLAYAESALAVDYLLRRHGTAAMRTLLAGLGESKDFASAFRAATGATYTEFQADWLRRLRPPPASIDSKGSSR
jgi:tetratricopeptide (TPR) repeat protein